MKYTRLPEMEEYILKRDFVSLDELCSVFEISKNTIRRDVAELLKNGAVEKVYGGVRALKPSGGVLLSYNERTVKHAEEKQAIGRAAAAFVEDNDIIFIDSGTTALTILPHLAEYNNVTVLTNNLHAANQCMDYPELTTISFGGQLNIATASFSANFLDMDNLKSFNVTKAFMTATGVSLEKGATNSSPGELPIKKSMVENSGTCILMADSTKFGHAALLTYAELCRFQYVITDKKPAREYLDYFKEHDVKLVL